MLDEQNISMYSGAINSLLNYIHLGIITRSFRLDENAIDLEKMLNGKLYKLTK